MRFIAKEDRASAACVTFVQSLSFAMALTRKASVSLVLRSGERQIGEALGRPVEEGDQILNRNAVVGQE
jgi:hypothetical protein